MRRSDPGRAGARAGLGILWCGNPVLRSVGDVAKRPPLLVGERGVAERPVDASLERTAARQRADGHRAGCAPAGAGSPGPFSRDGELRLRREFSGCKDGKVVRNECAPYGLLPRSPDSLLLDPSQASTAASKTRLDMAASEI